MFIINSSPLSSQRTFADYASFLFRRWVIRPSKQYKATEVHMVFDDPNTRGISPKDIERSRRDTAVQETLLTEITSETPVPSNWHSFLAVRKHKRLLVNFLSDYFIHLANQCFENLECLFITSGGYDNQFKNQARCAINGSSAEYLNASGCHEEADTRVWLHAAVSSADRIIIYSPDTDVSFIGLGLVKQIEKTVLVQLKDSPYEYLYLDLNKLIQNMNCDLKLQNLNNLEQCIEMLYIISGCDFVSFFRGYGKKTFFDIFRANAAFITGNQSTSHLADVVSGGGLYAFYRLVISVYFHRYLSAFYPLSSPKALFDSITADTLDMKYAKLISEIREKQWERVTSEIEIIPNKEALHFHWQRCSWVYIYWSKSLSNFPELPSLTDFGWSITDDTLKIIWDTEDNFKKVENTVEWYMKGCGCKTGKCENNRCQCRKKGKVCGPACKCQNCENLTTGTTEQLDVPFDTSLLDISEVSLNASQLDISELNFNLEEEDVDSDDNSELEEEEVDEDVQDGSTFIYWDVFENGQIDLL